MSETVLVALSVIPVFDSEGGHPTELIDLFGGDFFPDVPGFDFQIDVARFVFLQRIKLSTHFERLVMNRIKRKANDFITSDIGNRRFAPFTQNFNWQRLF